MAFENVKGSLEGAVAGEDLNLAADQFTAVKIDGATGKIVKVTSAGEFVAGILQNKPADGQAANVAVSGRSKARVVGPFPIPAGSLLSNNGDGALKLASSGDQIVGTMLDNATAAGQIVTVNLDASKL